jgi:hypothetical protein
MSILLMSILTLAATCDNSLGLEIRRALDLDQRAARLGTLGLFRFGGHPCGPPE